MSRRQALYTKVVLVLTVMALSVFGFIMFFMPERVELEFEYNISGYTPIENIRVMSNEPIGVQKVDANYTVYDYLMNEENARIYIPGYRFDGWFTGSGALITPETTFSKRDTLQARYTPYQYEIDFNLGANGYVANGMDLSFLEGVYNFDAVISLPTVKNQNGQYLFGNGSNGLDQDDLVLNKWVVHALSGTAPTLEYNAGGQFKIGANLLTGRYIQLLGVNPQDLLKGRITIQPTWKFQEVTVVLTLPMNPSAPVVGESFVLDEVTFVKGVMPLSLVNSIQSTITPQDWQEQYIHTDFDGWFLNDTYATSVNLSNHSFFNDTVIYAKFEYKTYDLDFNLTGGLTSVGDNFIASQSAKYDQDTALIMPEPPLKPGYRFTGWVTSGVTDLGDGDYSFNYSTPVFVFEDKLAADTTLYARWLAEEGVNFVTNPEANPAVGAEYFSFTTIAGGVRLTGVITNPNNWLNQPRDVILPNTVVYGGSTRDVIEIGQTALVNNNIRSITIGSNVAVINPTAFNAGVNSTLQNIFVNSYNQTFKDIEGVLYNKLGTVLIKYPTARAATNVLIGREGSHVTSIGQYAFFNVSKLQTITLNVEEVQSYAFKNTGIVGTASALDNVIFTTRLTTMGIGVFSGSKNLRTITIPSSGSSFEFDGRALYQNNNGGKLLYFLEYYNTNYTIKSTVRGTSVQYILEEAFSGAKVQSITFASSIIEIHRFAFAGNSILENIVLNNNLISIQEKAFQNCVSLNTIIIPNAVTIMGPEIFEGCVNLTIYARAASQPAGWNASWNAGRPVTWGYAG